jgi:hypothetical protein
MPAYQQLEGGTMGLNESLVVTQLLPEHPLASALVVCLNSFHPERFLQALAFCLPALLVAAFDEPLDFLVRGRITTG